MATENFLKVFEETAALLRGHFLLTSGLHSDTYFQCARVLQYPDIAAQLCSHIAANYGGRDIKTVIAPAIGGIVVSMEVARALGARSIFAERENGKMTLRRGFEIKPGEKVLVVEDVTTTGGSIEEVIDLVRAFGAVPVGAACLVDRSGGAIDLGLDLFALVRLTVETFEPARCKLCVQNIPLVKPGSRSIQ
jgi:orotate phosphoribosyltransferase